METAEYEIMFRTECRHWWYRALHRVLFHHLEQFLPEWRNGVILDAGCGTGAVMEKLSQARHPVGVDLSPEAIAFCRQRGLQNVFQADVSAMPFAGGSFDAVISSSVLYHQWVPDVPAALRETWRVLKPGGLLLVNVPACPALHSAHDEAVLTARRFTTESLRRLLAQNGFEICRMTGWTTLLFPAAWLARRARLSKKGRDFDDNQMPSSAANWVFELIMRLEFFLMRLFPLPAGVALFCVARKKEALPTATAAT